MTPLAKRWPGSRGWGWNPGSCAIDPPEPNLTPGVLIVRAAAMRGKLRERQDECERLGRLSDTTLQDYLDAGFYRVMQPRRFGGYEFDLDTFLHVAIELSRACPSSGWVYALTATHTLSSSACWRSRVRSSCSGTATSAARVPRTRSQR